MKIYSTCLLILLTAIPFNSISALAPAGELSHELWFYVALLIIPFVYKELLLGLKLTKSSIWILIFLFMIIVSVLANSFSIADCFFKDKTGPVRLLTQSMVLVFMLIIYFIVKGGAIKYGWNRIFDIALKASLISFSLVFCYTVLEIAASNNIIIFENLKNFIDYAIRDENYLYYNPERLRGVSFEAPFFGYYLSLVLPFFLYLTQTEKWKLGIFLTGIIIFLAIKSDSRFAEIVILVEILFYIFLLLIKNWRFKRTYLQHANKIFLFSIAFSLPILMFLFGMESIGSNILNIFSTDSVSHHTISNITRLSSAVALIGIYMDNPLFGVGFGQAGFNIVDYYPDWAYESYEIMNFSDPSLDKWWPPLYNTYLRLLAETGLGGWMFIFINVFIITKFLKLYFATNNIRVLALATFQLACMLAFFQFDTLRAVGFWFIFALVSIMNVHNSVRNHS